MKLISILFTLFSLSIMSYAQSDIPANMPPMKMLPKVGDAPKKIYELPSKLTYSLFDVNGKLVLEATGQFIDCSELDKGVYFIRYEDEVAQIEVE